MFGLQVYCSWHPDAPRDSLLQVMEETGVDVTAGVREENSFEVHVKQQRQKLYVVTEVRSPDTVLGSTGPALSQVRSASLLTNYVVQIAEDIALAPSMKGEIGAYGWFPIDQLPDSHDANQQGYRSADGTRHSFHNVWQFIGRLKRWIRRSQGRQPMRSTGRKNGNGKQKSGKTTAKICETVLHAGASTNGTHSTNTTAAAQSIAQAYSGLGNGNDHVGNGHAKLLLSAANNPGAAHDQAGCSLTSSSSSGSQESSQSRALSAPEHAWLGFRLNATSILDQLK